MSKTSTIGWRIIGSVVGFLVGGVALGLVGGLIVMQLTPDSTAGRETHFILIGLVSPGLPIGGTMGAAVGATVAQKVLRQRSSFWKTLLGAVVGLPIGVLCALTRYGIPLLPVLIVAGAVIGSGWKDKPADAAEDQS